MINRGFIGVIDTEVGTPKYRYPYEGDHGTTIDSSWALFINRVNKCSHNTTIFSHDVIGHFGACVIKRIEQQSRRNSA